MMEFVRDAIPEGQAANGSERYWRSQARQIMDRDHQVQRVVIVESKSEAIRAGMVARGGSESNDETTHVTVPSVGGGWGRSRQDFPPSGSAQRNREQAQQAKLDAVPAWLKEFCAQHPKCFAVALDGLGYPMFYECLHDVGGQMGYYMERIAREDLPPMLAGHNHVYHPERPT